METVEARQPAPHAIETAAPAPGSRTALVDLRRTAQPGRFVEALAGMNDESRARVTDALQRSAGNVAVARMLAHDGPRRGAPAGAAQLQRSPALVPIVVGGTNLGIGGYLAAGGTVAGGTALAEGTAVVVTGTVLAEGAAVVGTTAVAGGATLVAVPAAAATATGGVATAGVVAGGSATVPIVGWIVAGLIVTGIVVYLVYRATSDEGPPPVQAPSGSAGAPVTEPSSGPPVSLPPASGLPSGPMVDPGGPSAPAALPGAPHDGPVLASGDPDDRRGNVERLEDLERAGDYTGSDPVNLRERLMSDRPEVRHQAERELRSFEAAALAQRQQAPSSEPVPVVRPFTRDAAFEALMERYPRPLNTEPYSGHPRSHYEPVGWEQEQSAVPGELRHVLVIRGTQGNVANRQLRFSVSWNEASGQFEDIHEASGRP